MNSPKDIHVHGDGKLREQLTAGYRADATESLKIAVEWLSVEEQAWQKFDEALRLSVGLVDL